MISRKMGGLGSGNWDRFGSKTLVESCLYLDVNQFNHDGWLQPRQLFNLNLTNGANICVKTMAGAIELSYTISRDGQSEQVRYQVPLTWTECNYGGKRPWFICPGGGCGRRVGKLYLDGKYFLCRHCHNLAYQSQREGKEWRLLHRSQEKFRKLGIGDRDDLYLAQKPKGMHWKTFYRLCEEATLLDRMAMRAAAEKFGTTSRRLAGISDLK